MDALFPHYVALRWAESVLPHVQTLLAGAAKHPLTRAEETLLLALATLLRTVYRQVPYIRFGDLRSLQERATAVTLQKFLTYHTTHFLGAVLEFYTRFVLGRSGGQTVLHLTPDTLQTLALTLQNAVDVLAALEVLDAAERRAALREFLKPTLFQNLPVKHSFLKDVLEQKTLARCRPRLELQLTVERGVAERVLLLVAAWLGGRKKWLAISVFGFYVLPPAEPSPAARFEVEERFGWAILQRLAWGYPWGFCVGFCWVVDGGPVHRFLALQSAEDAREVLETTHALSGRTAEDRVPVLNDVVARAALELETRAPATNAALAECEGEGTVFLFNSELSVFGYGMDAAYWLVPSVGVLGPERNWALAGLAAREEAAAEDTAAAGLENFTVYRARNEKELAAIQALRAAGPDEHVDPLSRLPDWAFVRVAESEAEVKKYQAQLDAARKHLFSVKFQLAVKGIMAVTLDAEDRPGLTLLYDRKRGGTATRGKAKYHLVFVSHLARDRWRAGLSVDLFAEDPKHWKVHDAAAVH
ncbi:hypothetical protein GNI_061010 [Gregarina niphandrodes]|uniref:Uncharacterized protein n=1 Tax=Gregarina niphandrodes TaxID=110365 RepID=A0A023B8G8_GRENI|nr:hypothetical protein GNI_061010 [Gregarina niphandrodes]EZG68891.1 hypothetical protein GNI_061010 [Gregarina niphandrodes]|eukprot:XP_011134536.1 hypothetical protein GNI_061010 [Gregarina niphandrodes]